MEIKGLKKAVGDYQRINRNKNSASYGLLMLNMETGELWVDEYCGIGHNSYADYEDKAIINLGRIIEGRYNFDVTMKNVKYVIANCNGIYNYNKEN